MKVRIHPFLLDITKGEKLVEIEAKNVGECLTSLRARFPGISELLNKLGESGLIVLYLNGLAIYPDELNYPVKNSDELLIGVIAPGG